MNYHLTAKYKIERVGVSKKNKTADFFSRLGNETCVYQRSPPWLATRKIFWAKKSPGKGLFQSMIIHKTNTNQH